MTDIAMVCMPFSHLELPLMATGLLKACLVQRGFTCEAFYFHLTFASQLGYDEYELIDKHCSDDWKVGEWLFSHHVFDERAATIDQYLSTVATHVSHQPQFRHYLLNWREHVDLFLERLVTEIDWSSFSVVGFSLVHQQTMASLALARRIKQRYPAVQIVMGGGSCQGKMGQALYEAFSWIDYLCTGEGDDSFPALVECLIRTLPVPELPGILKREDNRIIIPQQSTQAVEKLDNLPIPDFTDYLQQLQTLDLLPYVNPGILAEGARGCWWGEKSPCTFCGLNGQTIAFRSKSNQRLLQEISLMLERYSPYAVKRIHFVENILSMKHLREVIPVLRSQVKDIELFYEVKVNLKHQDIVALRASNIVKVQPGIESFHDTILRLMAKGSSLLQNVQTLKWLMEYGIDAVYNLLYAFPGEPVEGYREMAETVILLKHLPQPRSIRQVRLERFSPYFDMPELYGIHNIRPTSLSRKIFPLPEAILFDLVHHFDFDFTGAHPDTYAKEWKAEVTDWMEHGGEMYCVAAHWNGITVCLDTRFDSQQTVFILEGIEAKIFDLCDAIQSPGKIAATLDLPEEAVRSTLESLVQAKYVLRVESRYLSLAVRVDRSIPASISHLEEFIDRVKDAAQQLSLPLLHIRDEMISTANYKEIWAN